MRVLGVTLALGILFFSTAGRTASLHSPPERRSSFATKPLGRSATLRSDIILPGERCAGFPNPYRTVRLDRLGAHSSRAMRDVANPFNARYMSGGAPWPAGSTLPARFGTRAAIRVSVSQCLWSDGGHVVFVHVRRRERIAECLRERSGQSSGGSQYLGAGA